MISYLRISVIPQNPVKFKISVLGWMKLENDDVLYAAIIQRHPAESRNPKDRAYKPKKVLGIRVVYKNETIADNFDYEDEESTTKSELKS